MCLILFCSRSTAASEFTPEEEKQRQDEAGLRAPSPLIHGHISSDESETEGPEEVSEFPSSSAHPRPASVSRLYWLQSVNQAVPAKTFGLFTERTFQGIYAYMRGCESSLVIDIKASCVV